VHLRDGRARAGLHGFDDRCDLVRRPAGALGELADLVGYDGEARAVLALLRGDDRGIEREEVGLVSRLLR
jgi:hypothetical protein